MKKMDMSKYFDMESVFCLNSKKVVENLEVGAKMYGGATKYNNICYSNYNENTNFDVKEQNNTVGIRVPSTINVNEVIDNTKFVNRTVETLEYFGFICQNLETEGSWMANNGEIVIEKGNLVTFKVNEITKFVMDLLKALASELKTDMKQEGISIIVENGLIVY